MSELQVDPRTLSEDGAWDAEVDGFPLVFGEGSLERLGELGRRLGCGSVLLVSDPGLREAGHVEAAARSLRGAGLDVAEFDGVEENPTTRHVERGRRLAERAGIDGIVGLGGGSAMDCAKGINFLLTNGGRMEDYRGRDRAPLPMLPSIGVPTTAGTGSEAQSFALISREDTGAKMACGDGKARFRAVILDPALLASAPRGVLAAAGMDAVSHAVESYVTTRRDPVSRLFAREGWRLLATSLEAFLADPTDAPSRGRMLLGAHFAGAAIEHSMLGAAHACANPLTSRFGVAHGVAVGLMLPPVVRFNHPEVGRLYEELEREAGHAGRTSLATRLQELRAAAGLPATLRECGIPREALEALAGEAAGQWTAGFNPRRVARRELLELYETAY